jgi:hypothetical protein
MHLCRLTRLLAAIAISCTIPSLALAGLDTWTSGGPAGQAIRALAIHPTVSTTLYAGSESTGMYRSVDGGDSWTPINTGLTDLRVFAISIDPLTPTVLLVGTNGGGVFRSLDAGDTWVDANVGLTNLSVFALVTDPAAPSTVYAGTNGGGVFRSLDGGTSWTVANVGLSNHYIQALAIDPASPAVLYAGTFFGGIFKTVDGAVNWSDTGLGALTVWTIAIDPLTPGTAYAGLLNGGVYKTTNSGALWLPMSAGITADPPTVRSIAIDPLTPTTLYAGTPQAGVFISIDAGLHWGPLNAGLTPLNVAAVRVDPVTPTILHAGTIGGGAFDYEQTGCDDGGQPVVCGPCSTCHPAYGCIGYAWSQCRKPTQLRTAKLTIKDKEPSTRDRIVWTWKRGQETPIEAYGDPLTDTLYDVCMIDESVTPPAVQMHATVEPALLCNGKPCWKAVEHRRYRYRNGDAIPDGVTKLLLNAGESSHAKVILKAKGELLGLPSLPMGLPFRLQLHNDLGECWGAVYTEAGTRKNEETQYVGKSGL